MSTFKSNCTICSCHCGVNIEVSNGNILSISGDPDSFSRGFICKKGLSISELANSKDRIKAPLRKNLEGVFEEISWEEAISDIALNLRRAVDKSGSRSIAIHTGDHDSETEFSNMAKSFLNAIKSPNYSDNGSYCNLSRDMANRLVHGFGDTKPDFANSEAIILWGSNPRSAHPRFAKDIEEARKKGAKLVVIDPVENNLAKEADLYIQIRPGSDGALALGLMNLLLEKNAYDKNLAEQHSVGFEELKEYAKNFSLLETEISTWVPEDKVLELAAIYENSSRICSSIGVGIEHQTNGVQSIRAICSLNTLTGNLDIIGGNKVVGASPFNCVEIASDMESRPLGHDKFPLLSQFYGLAQINVLADSVLEGNPYGINFLMVHDSNLAASLPNTKRVLEAFEALDYIVVIDTTMTETAEMADMVLPATLYPQREQLYHVEDNGDLILGLNSRIVEFNGLTEVEFLIELAKELGLAESLGYRSGEELLSYRLSKSGLNLQNMKELGNSFKYGNYEPEKYAAEGFRTPSKKIEFKSSVLEEHGYEPLPFYREPAESMLTNPPNSEHIFTAITGARASSAEIEKESKQRFATAHKALFKKYHKKDGETVIVSSKRGSIEMAIKLSDRICPNTISIPKGSGPQNPNFLVDSESLDPIVGYAGSGSFLISIDHED